MNVLIWLAAGFVVFGILAYHRASLATFTGAIAAILVGATISGDAGQWSWLVFALLALPLNIAAIRQTYISKPLLKVYRSIMPEMSSTEKDAIEAGTVWWEGELFRGAPDWSKLHHYPAPRLSAEEQAFLDGPVEEVCRMTNDWEITHERADLPPEIWSFLKEHKFFAMIIKKEYGGLEFSAYAQSRVLQKLVGSSAVLASTVGVPNSLGPGELLQHYGTEAQRNHYLPRLAQGKEIPCFALTSPEAGSDAGAIPDFGIVCKDQWQGEEVLGMRLTWNKRYITLAPIATVLGLAFKLRDPDGLLGDEKELGITCALIPTSTPGVETGRRHFPLNVPFQNGPTHGKDVFVPIDYIIGGPKMAGQGWRMLVECLSVGRAITLPSNSAGGAKSLAMATGAYARIRRQFKLPIGKMEGIQEPLARIGGNAYLMDSVTTMTTGAIDLGEKPSVLGAICKYHLTDRSQKTVIDAMDIHGGKGVCMGPANYLARAYQGSPIAVTVEGANILTRSMMIYGQGAIRCHPYVLPEMQAAMLTDDREALGSFDRAVFGHIGFAISNFFRATWLGLSGAKLAKSPFKDQTSRYYKQMSRFSADLALLSDLCMATLGGDLKRRERISARLGDLLSQLYLASCALKRFNDEGRQQEDLPLLQWAVEDALYKLQESLRDLLNNFPVRWLGATLKVLLMPWGAPLRKPSDSLDRKVAELLQTPSEARSRLGHGQYLTDEEGNPIGRLEGTLALLLKVEPIVDAIAKKKGKKIPFIFLDRIADEALAEGWIEQDEAALLKQAEEGRLYTINVDDFDNEALVADKSTLVDSKARSSEKAA
ncbi:acyl-CoA dehydrogenase FadE [Corallincola spongiicola]|uniref:Acyl-coenzyme A dehydrogenase n=1 Tax=Corallincola spongiicola TaxID=2520508 RepID=A0ABY1WV97_9GAMM|nr:acyl-CoA dehydrogenase FadE [Corallincola spongiicola]TAA48663.1 acyl-CoA dehydrogenase [Corallincola spongiicola]